MITIENLSVNRGGRRALYSMSATLAPGQLIAVIGPNGAGKSTLLQAIAGINKDTSGRVELNGRSIEDYGAHELAHAVAYLPQDHHVSWPITVRNVVQLGRLPYTSSLSRLGDDDTALVDRAMDDMAVTHLQDRAATSLSGGELARVLIARLLAQDTPVVLADEPAAGLDPAHALALFEHLKKLADNGRSVVMAMHDLSFAARFCDHALLLKDGHVVAIGPPRDVLTRDHLATAYGVAASIGEVEGLPVVIPSHAVTS